MSIRSYVVETLFAWGHYPKGARIPEAPPNYARELVRRNRAVIVGDNVVV